MPQQARPQLRGSRSSSGRCVKNRLYLFLIAVVAILGAELAYFATLYTTTTSDDYSGVSPELRNDDHKSNLFLDWRTNILEAARNLPKVQQTVSFRVFDLKQSIRNVEPPPPFFYPVEETLHSATYILTSEKQVVRGWMEDLRQAQATKSPQLANCLDIGANGGFFSLMSRAAGCRTLAVDAQPWCLQRLSSAATLNEFTTNLDVRWTAVGEDQNQTIRVGATKCSGLWAVKESDWVNQESSVTVDVSMSPLLDVVADWLGHTGETIDLFKIDVEGSEMAVLHSALPLFAANRIGSVYAEIAPGRTIKISNVAAIVETIEGIYTAGYFIQYVQKEKEFDLDEAKSWFSDRGARYRNDPDMFEITKRPPRGEKKKSERATTDG